MTNDPASSQASPTTGTTGDGTVLLPPVVPASGEALYDEIMGAIEPDLMTAELPLLAERYKDEAPEDCAARAQRYTAAFAEYEKRFAQRSASWSGEMRAFVRAVQCNQEEAQRSSDADLLGGLDQQMSSV